MFSNINSSKQASVFANEISEVCFLRIEELVKGWWNRWWNGEKKRKHHEIFGKPKYTRLEKASPKFNLILPLLPTARFSQFSAWMQNFYQGLKGSSLGLQFFENAIYFHSVVLKKEQKVEAVEAKKPRLIFCFHNFSLSLNKVKNFYHIFSQDPYLNANKKTPKQKRSLSFLFSNFFSFSSFPILMR